MLEKKQYNRPQISSVKVEDNLMDMVSQDFVLHGYDCPDPEDPKKSPYTCGGSVWEEDGKEETHES